MSSLSSAATLELTTYRVLIRYYIGDAMDLVSIHSLILQICPSLIVHAACPNATSATAKVFHQVTDQGTESTLQVARKAPFAEVFIFTSSGTMAVGPEHIGLDESTRREYSDPNSHP